MVQAYFENLLVRTLEYCWSSHIAGNILAVKKGVTLFKMACAKKLWNQGGGQEMTVMVKVDGKNFITIQVNFVLTPSEAGMRQHWTFVVKFLPSIYTRTVISWLPPLISQLFLHWPFLTGPHLILQPSCFWVDNLILYLHKK